MRAQNQHREPQSPEQQGLCFPPKNDLAKPSNESKLGGEVRGTLGNPQVLRGSCSELTGREASLSTLHQCEEPSLVLILKEEDSGRRNSRKTTWFPPLGKMRPLAATASQGKSPVPP